MTDRAILASAVKAWLALYRHELGDPAIRELLRLVDPDTVEENTFKHWKAQPIEPVAHARVLQLIGPKK
jgi:hypothetical protein